MRRPFLLASLAATLLILGALLVLALGFTADPEINGGETTYTQDDLVCSWSASGDTANLTVTWLKDGVVNRSDDHVAPLPTNATINASETTRDETWTCQVTIRNATSVTRNDNVTIENTAPLTPILSYLGQSVGSAMNLTEDEATPLNLNSSDVDNDTLTYYMLDTQFCSSPNPTTGAVTCMPTHDYLDTNASGAENESQVQVEFWVRDTPPNTKSASKTIIFTLIPVNDPPSVSIPNQSTLVNETFNETFAITDEEGDTPINASLDPALTSANISDDLTLSVEGGSTLRVVYETDPVELDDVGNHTVAINLTDAGNASSLVTFTLEIIRVNQAPYFTSITPANHSSSQQYAYVLLQGESILINLSANDPDTAFVNESLTFSGGSPLFSASTTRTTANSTDDALGQINYTAVNADVGSYLVDITVEDGSGASNRTTLNFTIQNVNDPPVIYNRSLDSGNTGGNVNITPLIAYLDAPFSYQINYSDPDTDIGLDTLNWTDNATAFDVDSNGLISFTPSGQPRNESINITVSDLAGLSDSRLITLEIRNNTPPYFNGSFPLLACSEGQGCSLNLSLYAREDDADDNVSAYAAAAVGTSLASFSVDSGNGMISFTPDQEEIGNYTYNITISDSRAASAWQLLNITINNTEDAPVWQQYDFSGATIVEEKAFSYQVFASDEDLLISGGGENLTFSANITWVSLSYEQRTGSTVYALLSMTPNSSQTGDHAIQLNVTDSTGRVDTESFTFTVLGDTDPPSIDAIRPYGNDSADDQIVVDWEAPSGQEENLTLLENTSDLVFAVNVSDDDQAGPPYDWLTYAWYYNGELNKTGSGDAGRNVTLDFGFFSSGNHTLEVVVNDTRLESTTFTWNLEVTDVNRPPVLLGNFTGTKNNLTVSETYRHGNYFVYSDSVGGFYDPDDDEGGLPLRIDANDTLNLSYESTACQYAELEMTGNDLEITPQAVGTCYVLFNATDPAGASAVSNLVQITVSEVPQGAESTTISSGGGGGGTTTQNTLLPISEEIETPRPLTLIAPGKVTIYENATARIPITIKNNWTETIRGIMLSAETNASDVSTRFDTYYIEELLVNASQEVSLTVEGYRLGENFELKVLANATEPRLQDSALITFNSIEQRRSGQDEVEVKVTFAQDLLSQSEECQELNEYLQEAEQLLREGKSAEANRLLDFVINGCKYMISSTPQPSQQPGPLTPAYLELDPETLRLIGYIALAVFVLASLLGLLYYHHRVNTKYDF